MTVAPVGAATAARTGTAEDGGRRGPRLPRAPARLAGALVALLVAAAPAGAQDGRVPSRPLRFVTLNVLHGGVFSGLSGRDDHLEARLDLVAERLRALAPDVVALQEASWSRRRGNVASRLAGRLGMNYAFAPAMYHFFPSEWLNARVVSFMDFEEGPAVLSRFPLLRREIHRLPLCGRPFDPRVLLFVELAAPHGRLPVFSAHTSGDACQARQVAGMVRERRGDLPAVVMGDFNAVESSEAIMALTAEAGFVDVFRAVHRGDPGATVWQPVTAPERRARRRVDYIFLVPGRRVLGAVVDSRVVVDQPGVMADGTRLWPSDHYGVLADLAVLPSTAPTVAAGDDRSGEASLTGRPAETQRPRNHAARGAGPRGAP